MSVSSLSHSPLRIAIVGLGNVGASFAFALLLRRIAAEIVLIDSNHKKAEGEAMDLNHAVPFGPSTRIWAGDYNDCRGAAVVVITAGAAQRPGETRLQLLDRNLAIFRDIVPKVVEQNPDALLLIATNPVDILSYASYKLSGLPSYRVIGSGTILDTARFRYLLGQHFSVDARSVHGFILGEHGDTEVPIWSLANIAGIRLREYCRIHGHSYNQDEFDRIFADTRDAAYKIIDRKGATYYAVAVGLLQIVEALVRDQHTVLTTSTLVDGAYGLKDVYLSLPTIVGAKGVVQVLTPDLADEEITRLQHSAKVLRDMIDSHIAGH